MTTRKNAGNPGDLHEIIADIAYTAGIARHYSGDSRADMHTYICWAEEFARTFTQEQEDNGEYMELIEAFADAKLAEAGNCDTPTAEHPGAHRMHDSDDNRWTYYSSRPTFEEDIERIMRLIGTSLYEWKQEQNGIYIRRA